MSVGSDLKHTRESKQITLEFVSQKTKIPVKYLEAIEENRFDVFPSQTYAKGFIRAYAKVVGADPQGLTRQFKTEVVPQEIKVVTHNAEADLEKALGWHPTLGRPPVIETPRDETSLNLELVENFGEPLESDSPVLQPKGPRKKRRPWRMGRGVLAFILLAALVAGGYTSRGFWQGIKWRTHAPASPSAPEPAAAPPGKAPASLVVADKYQHLVLKALDKSWVLVSIDDGQSSSEADLDQGETKIYKALKNFKLKLGNAGGVDVQFNGKSLGVLGTEGQVVEITLPPGTSGFPADTDSNQSGDNGDNS